MTDTAAREEAVERVRALAEGAMQPHEWGYRDPVVGGFVEDRTPFDLADHVLRLLLSGGDGGSVASLPVKAVDEPATPLSDALLAARQALEPFVAFINVAEDAATMNWGVQIEDSKVVGSVSGETGSAKLRAKDLRRAREANAAIQAALTDPRQPSEAGDASWKERTAAAEAEARKQWGWKNWTRLGVANYLRRAGFRSEVAIEKANEICGPVHPREAQSEATASLPKPPVTADEGWRPIEGAPNKRDWLKHSGDFLVGLLHQPHNEDGEEDGEPYWLWRAVAYLSADGWMVRSTGFRGLHGNCSFPLNDNATHWRPLPPAPPTGEGEP